MNPNLELHDRLVRDHHRKLRAEADDWRMLQSEEQEVPNTPVYGPLLARAGAVLSDLGEQLQQRYGDAMDVAPLTESPSGEVPC